MANIASSANQVIITNSTVGGVVGLCYFDPITETLLEINDIPNHVITIDPGQNVLRKYYIVVSPGETVAYIKIKFSNTDVLNHQHSIKTIIGDIPPTVNSFAVLPEFNSFRFLNPDAGAFVPVWLLISSKYSLNEVVNISVDLEYE